MKTQKLILGWLAGLVLLFANASAFAVTQIVSVTPSSVRAPLGQAFSTNLTWRVMTVDPAATIISTSGEFRLGSVNGTVLGTVNKTLSRFAPNTTPVTMTESLLIPRDVIYNAFKAGASRIGPARIVYVRAFDDGDAPDLGAVVNVAIDIASPSAASFSVSRLAMSFEDNAIEKIADENQFLRAKAVISHTGSGVVRGIWEVADPSSTAGTPVYRPLTRVSEFLSAGGDKTLLSPRLPTDAPGLYLVRFRVTDPELFDSAPVLRYFVQQAPTPREPVTQVAPPHLALLGKETRFVWQPIAGVRAYQLELFQQGLPVELPSDAAPVDEPRAIDPRPGAALAPSAGLLVPGDQTSVPLTLLTRAHLDAGRTYLWRVLAIGPQGTVIGESPLRAIRVP